MKPSLARRLAAEFTGTLFLLAAVVGSGINLLANLNPAPAAFHSSNIPAGSDIQMSVAHGAVTLEYRAHGGAGPWVAAVMNA
jgi:hypothetical protein